MDSYVHLFSILGAVVAATWLLRSKLSDIEVALRAHVVATEHELSDHRARIITLEDRRTTGRRP
jgi:hypothetical protein